MQAAVLNNSTTEPGKTTIPASFASTTESEQSQDHKVVHESSLRHHSLSRLPPKRKLPWLDDNASSEAVDKDDEPFPWSPTPAEEQALSKAADLATSLIPAPETPRKAQKASEVTTPHHASTTFANGLPTPNTSSRKLDYLSITPFADLAPQTTPKQPKFRDALAVTPSRVSTGDLSGEVFSYLVTTAAHLPPEQSNGLRAILDNHTLKMQGVSKGRDVLRSGIQTREETITKLRQRVAQLESEAESQKAVSRHLRQMLEENRKAALEEASSRRTGKTI